MEEIDALFERPFNPFKQQQIYETAQQAALGRLEHHTDEKGGVEHIEGDVESVKKVEIV